MLNKRARISVRAHSSAYISVAAAGSFLAAYLIYLEYDIAAFVTLLISVLCYPILAFSDRIVFDGKRLSRTGPIWNAWMLATGRPRRAKPRAVVHVETEALRAFRRGANITYLYRTTLFAEDVAFRIGSGRGYRRMVKAVLPLIAEGCLDVRSLELRDHFSDPSSALARARYLKIPRSDVLDPALMVGRRTPRPSKNSELNENDFARSDELRSVANQLRANGRLVQALEAFRRAVRFNPTDPGLLYEFGRCLQSLAAARRDDGLDRRSRAMLRLAESRSGGDIDLLSRIGETYFSIGLWHRAENAFRKASNLDNAGYRIFRGLGELALRDGKIAHAINYFSRSAEVAKPRQLFRWAKAEADYLRHLNDDEEYMELELGRINLFDTFDSARKTSLKVFIFGAIFLIAGLSFAGELAAEIGWAVSGLALIVCFASSGLRQTFSSRIPFELLDKDK